MRNDVRAGARVVAALFGLLLACGTPATARADFEFWVPVEFRVPVLRTPTPTWPRLDWRVIAEARFAGRFNGAEQVFFRIGPVLYVSPWFFVAAHGVVAADALATTAGMPARMEEELRAEIEPTFFGRIGPFTLVNRNRFEYRWRQTYDRTRARVLLRVNLAPLGWRVLPFAQDEILVDVTDSRAANPASVPPAPGLNQNRVMAGVGFQLLPSVRLDVAALLRARQVPGQSDWALDAGPWIQLFVDITPLPAPPPPPPQPPTTVPSPARFPAHGPAGLHDDTAQ